MFKSIWTHKLYKMHDGHLPFWLPGFVRLIMLLLHVLFACWN